MIDKEILEAMQAMINKSQDTAVQQVKGMIEAAQSATDAKVETAQAATDAKVEAAQAATDAKIESSQKGTMAILREEMDNVAEVAANKAVQRVQVLLENREDKQIQLLIEGQREILRRLPDAEEQGEIKARVTTLEHVTAEHTKEIQKLQQA